MNHSEQRVMRKPGRLHRKLQNYSHVKKYRHNLPKVSNFYKIYQMKAKSYLHNSVDMLGF